MAILKGEHSYHETIDGVIYTWNVRNLWKHASKLPVKEVELKEFKSALNYDVWFNLEESTLGNVIKHIRRINRANTRYPIILTPEKQICDGHHRLAKLLMKRKKFVKCVVFDKMPKPDAVEKTKIPDKSRTFRRITAIQYTDSSESIEAIQQLANVDVGLNYNNKRKPVLNIQLNKRKIEVPKNDYLVKNYNGYLMVIKKENIETFFNLQK